ncbi:hypothetical protein CVT24_000969 [Panaeolus cyanescens]|uniref:NADH:flavin oxidoreductase/NADH oxidase N-terminal domain-containing protein n=1 Tax=Panaeolus cyanescens TaxID=181874 RepID=A0A409YCE1_9AGAR|nr:hypothetical protein CVT24_000969 [Panaeolus cyanescens]
MVSSTHQRADALFQPIKVGNMTLGHCVAMAPLTRFRADDNHVPLPHVVDYYTQRASVPGTLLITEATFIAPQAGGYANAPGIWSKEQLSAWRKITDAVHLKKSYIYLQLWALGRAGYPKQLQKEGNLPYVSSSPVPLADRPPSHPAPRALTIEEVKQYVEWYAQAAVNAIEAGFDGVEVHGANGYLIDQFIQDVCNKRTDEYGGSIENRTRFALEVVDAIVKRVGQKRTAIRVSPWATYQGMGMKDPLPTFTYLVNQLRDRFPDLAYLHTVEKRLEGATIADDIFVENGSDNDFIRALWTAKGKKLITAGGYTRESARKVAQEKGDIIAFGRLFISNPDLPYKLRKGLPVLKGDRSRYYTKGTDPKGYTDYPFSPEFALEQEGHSGKSHNNHIPLPQVVEYYSQRASIPGTLIITEASVIAPQAAGYEETEPGIWSRDQMEAWRKVVSAVHQKRSYIYLQLWALGRAAFPEELKKGNRPYVSASPIPLSDRASTDPPPRELTVQEIGQYIEWYAQAAENAITAGFDGVEIHAANGYLIDQFLQDVCNKRSDQYGGSIENRARFALEVVDAVVKRIGQKRTAIRISPTAPYQDMGMKDPVPTFTYLVNELLVRYPELAYLHAVEERIGGDCVENDRFGPGGTANDFIRKIWSDKGKRLITAGGYTRESATSVAQEKGDIVAFGRLFISNVSRVSL